MRGSCKLIGANKILEGSQEMERRCCNGLLPKFACEPCCPARHELDVGEMVVSDLVM